MKPQLKLALGAVASIALVAAGAPSSFASTTPPFSTITVVNTGLPLNPYNSNFFMPHGFNYMPLAWSKNTANINAFWPSLAKSWSLSKNGRELTIHIQKNARWSNGTPVTAKDVSFSFAALATVGLDSYELTGVKIVNPYEIVLERASQPFNLFENQVLQQVITPAQVYGKFLPKNIWDLIRQSQYTGSNKSLIVEEKKASAQLATIAKKLQSYNPPKPLGELSDGAFVITGSNSGQVSATKNKYYWDASKIHVRNVTLYNDTGNQSVWAMMMSGKTDQATSAMPQNVQKQASKVPGNKFFPIGEYAFSGILFNQKDYPYNLVQVRQALAYLINRQLTSKVEMPYTKPANIPGVDGMGNSIMKALLTPAQIKKLSPYNYSPTKATKLLESVGFKKSSSGNWLLPNGQPWNIKLYVPSGLSDWIQGASYIANQLSSFGIPSSIDTVNSTTFTTLQDEGKYPMSFLGDSGGPSAYQAFDAIYGAPGGFNLSGGQLRHTWSKQKGNYVQSPMVVNIRGIGKVNLGRTTLQLARTASKKVLNANAYKLAIAFNRTVPMIPTEDEMVNGFVSTKYYTDYPLNNSLVMHAQYYFAPIEWMELGYIKPKS